MWETDQWFFDPTSLKLYILYIHTNKEVCVCVCVCGNSGLSAPCLWVFCPHRSTGRRPRRPRPPATGPSTQMGTWSAASPGGPWPEEGRHRVSTGQQDNRTTGQPIDEPHIRHTQIHTEHIYYMECLILSQKIPLRLSFVLSLVSPCPTLFYKKKILKEDIWTLLSMCK